MRGKRIILIFSLLIMLSLGMGLVSAIDSEEINGIAADNTAVNTDLSINDDSIISQNMEDEESDNLEVAESDKVEKSYDKNNVKSINDSLVKAGNTITVDGKAVNQMSDPTIQDAIDSASDGDTIIIKGTSYVHCHFVVDKKLTIISEVGTKMTPCPSNTEGSGSHGIFYISEKGSGTVIQGFTFVNDLGDSDDYGVYIRGANDVEIKNCNISCEAGNGILVESGENVKVENSIVEKSDIGIKIINSTNTNITNNNITNNTITGIYIGENNVNTTIQSNNITYNKITGINMSSAEYVYILSNFIAYNRNGDSKNSTIGAGVYVNCNITKIDIIGNYIKQNGLYGILNDYRVLNMDASKGAEKLENVTNNYFGGHSDRVTYHIKYSETTSGDFTYDEETDTYIYVGSGNGNYDIGKTVVYLREAFLIGETVCGTTLYAAPSTTYSSSRYELKLSNITQVSKGVYKVSVVDYNGNPATGLNSLYVNFYLNKNTSSAEPSAEDTYQTILTEDGTAIVKFKSTDFLESGNIVTASFPGLTEYYKNNPYVEFYVNDTDIPGTYSQTRIEVENMTSVPQSGENLQATLYDEYNNTIANQKIYFKISGTSKTYEKTTDENGQANLRINMGTGSYTIIVSYEGDEEHNQSTNTSKLTIKKQNQEIVSSNTDILPSSGDNFTVTLKDETGKAIANKEISFSIFNKIYNKTTDENGQASLKINIPAAGNYTIKTSSPATNQYKKATATNTITIKSGATKVNLITNDSVFMPKSGEYFNASLSDENGNPLTGKKITFSIFNKNYTKTTNENGIAQLKININNEDSYKITAKYAGDDTYNSASSKSTITIKKGDAILSTYDRTFIIKSGEYFHALLKDANGNPLANKNVSFTIFNKKYNKTTNSEGLAELKINILKTGNYSITTSFAGDKQQSEATNKSTITIVDDNAKSFVDKDLPNQIIQAIIDESCGNIEFLGNSYDDVDITINKSANIYTNANTTLNGKTNNIVLNIFNADYTNISNFNIKSNSSNGIIINSSDNTNIINNTITNIIEESLSEDYENGSTILPGEGITIINSTQTAVSNNDISSFESGIYLIDSEDLTFTNNTISKNNYGIKYGENVKNTELTFNTIIDNIGWYTKEVPEGPRGYGIFFNNSAINVTINQNNISNNYIGISIDCNNSTGINITSNLIADNSLEGIRFNAGYDLADNAVEPYVTDNAIYRNAEGPSMMILGELSANPEGIYGPGQWNDSLKLKLDANWYGANTLKTWDYDTGIVGVGTICPRIKTTPIYFENLTYQSKGTYSINFYKNGTFASNLASFDLYATLNRDTDQEEEIQFIVKNGTGTFSFDTSKISSNSKIEISVGSLNSQEREFTVIFTYYIPSNEI